MAPYGKIEIPVRGRAAYRLRCSGIVISVDGELIPALNAVELALAAWIRGVLRQYEASG